MYRVINEVIKNGNLYAIATEAGKYYLWLSKKIVATIDADDDKRVKQLLEFMDEINGPEICPATNEEGHAGWKMQNKDIQCLDCGKIL